MKKYLLVMLLMASACSASNVAFVVMDTTSRSVFSNNQGILSVPRYQECFNEAGTKMYYQVGTDLRMSLDTGRTVTSTFDWSAEVGGAITDHAHFNIRRDANGDDTLDIFSRITNGSTNPASYFQISENAGFTLEEMDSTTLESFNSNFNVVSGIGHNASDSVFMSGRETGAPTDNDKCWISPDNGATWSAPIDIHTDNYEPRNGYVSAGDEIFYLSYNNSTEANVYHWDRSGQTWIRYGKAATSNNNRNICIGVYDDTLVFIVGFDNPYDADIDLHGAYNHINGDTTTWTTIPTVKVGDGNGSGTAPTMMFSTLTFIESSKRMFLTYNRYYDNVTTTEDSCGIFGMLFDFDSNSWKYETRLSSGYQTNGATGGLGHTGAGRMPLAWGDMAIIQCRQARYSDADIDTWLIEVRFTDILKKYKGILK